MPYHLQPAGKNKYYVVTTTTGKKHSTYPLTRDTAIEQMRALYANVKH